MSTQHDAESGLKALNPYLNARREWNERYGDYIAQARNWRVAAILALGIALLSSGGLVYVAGQSQIVPYVVRVDKLGTALAVDRADEAAKPDKPLIVAQICAASTPMRARSAPS